MKCGVEAPSLAVEIVFETHALTVDNEQGSATGWRDGRLSERGRRLAMELGERRRREDVAALFTSDLGRAIETVAIAFGPSGIPVYRDWRLRECNYGALNGAPVAQLEGRRAQHIDDPYPEGESYREVVERVRAFLNDLCRAYDGARVVVIGHAATRWALDHLLAGTALEDLVDDAFGWREGWTYVVPNPSPARSTGTSSR
jgi:broad specificity phosphatase PhoE